MSAAKGTCCKRLLLAILLLASGSAAFKPQCCPDGEVWIEESRNCSNGGSILLHCSSGAFLFDQSEEPDEKVVFVDLPNGTWVKLVSDGKLDYNISPKSYCVIREKSPEDVVLMVCFTEQAKTAHPVWRDFCFGMFSVVSCFFLALTLLVYLVLPELRDLQDKAMMSLTASFMVAFFLSGNQQLAYPSFDDATCLLVAFTMYYAYLAAFFWLNITSFNVWRSVWYPNFRPGQSVIFLVYCAVGWGMPLLFLAVSLTTHHVEGSPFKPGFGEVNCWFNGGNVVWIFFYGPMLALLLMNLVYLALTGWKLWHVYKELDCCKLKVLRLKCIMCARLAIMMGFTWIFEIISFASGDSLQIYWLIPDILNTLQGLFIFILCVVSRRRVRKLLAKKRPFNIPFPKSWAAYEDNENCEPVGPEEVELSQSVIRDVGSDWCFFHSSRESRLFT